MAPTPGAGLTRRGFVLATGVVLFLPSALLTDSVAAQVVGYTDTYADTYAD